MNHGHAHAFDGLRPTFIHWLDLLGALLLQPQAELVNARDLRIVFLGKLNGVADVVAMPMRAEHHIDLLETLLVVRTSGIVHHPWVNQDRLP